MHSVIILPKDISKDRGFIQLVMKDACFILKELWSTSSFWQKIRAWLQKIVVRMRLRNLLKSRILKNLSGVFQRVKKQGSFVLKFKVVRNGPSVRVLYPD